MTSRRRVGLFLFFLMIVLPSCSSSCCGGRTGSGAGCTYSGSCSSCSFPSCSSGCADDERPRLDAWTAPDAQFIDATNLHDVRGVDAVVPPRTCGDPGQLGGHCGAGGCADPWTCQEEITSDLPSVTRADPSMDGRAFPARYFLGSTCIGACVLGSATECNDCSRCVDFGIFDDGAHLGECRATCDADLSGRGGCVGSFACERGELACLEACAVSLDGVDSCQFTFEDRDADPDTRETIVDEGIDFPRTCNEATGLCETIGRMGATAGDDCVTDFDCEDDGTCVRSDATEPITTLSDGYCIRRGCNETDLPCREGDVCAHSLFELPGGACMQGCEVGAETMDSERLGAAGGHPECGANEACFWDGTHRLSDPLNGACYPGNYNDVPAYNVGAECQRDDECWSPFGLGRCLFLDDEAYARTGRGICVVGGCGATTDGIGLRVADEALPVERPDDLCRGGTDICVGLIEQQTYCIHQCDDALACPDGWACPNLGDALRPLRVCWPMCLADTDCRTGVRCLDDSGEVCDPLSDTCFCNDAIAPVDAGVEPPDASTGEDAGADAP